MHMLRRLGPADAPAYRALRLEGLERYPESFGAAWAEEAAHPLPWFAGRLQAHRVFGGWLRREGDLAGLAGLMLSGGAKQRHKGVLWGMYVRPEARGTGLAAALVRQVIEEAHGLVEELRLTVGAGNDAAIRLYEQAGFEAYGREPRGLKVDGRYFDELLMARRLD
jgi:ribosomal protein S18 acetylase RimI-like enzyme